MWGINVYVVQEQNDRDSEPVCGVFVSLKAAREYIRLHTKTRSLENYIIERWLVEGIDAAKYKLITNQKKPNK